MKLGDRVTIINEKLAREHYAGVSNGEVGVIKCDYGDGWFEVRMGNGTDADALRWALPQECLALTPNQ